MSLLAINLPADAVAEKTTRRALINAICERTPTGAGRGQRTAKKSRHVSPTLGRQVAIEGASRAVCETLGIPPEWAERCEDFAHVGHDNTHDGLATEVARLRARFVIKDSDDSLRGAA